MDPGGAGKVLSGPAPRTIDEAWGSRVEVELDGVRVPILGKADLIRNKRAVGRTRDLADLEQIEGS